MSRLREDEICGRCKFFEALDITCHYNPAPWPSVETTGWCGQWQNGTSAIETRGRVLASISPLAAKQEVTIQMSDQWVQFYSGEDVVVRKLPREDGTVSQ